MKDRTNDFDRRDRSIEFLKNLQFGEFIEFCQKINLESCPTSRIEVVPENLWSQCPQSDESLHGQTKNFGSAEEIDTFFASDALSDYGEWLDSVVVIDEDSQMSRL